MLITCLTCKINVNLVPLDERDINIVDYLFHPHSTPYLEQLKSNEATRICTSCQENIRDIDKFRNSALKNFLQLMQVLEIKPILRTCAAQSTSQQDTLAEIQSPSLDSTVLVKTERSELDAEELHIKPDLEDGIDEEQPQSDLSRMMLDNILQGMYVAKTTPTVINVTEEAVSNPASQSSQHDQVEDKSVATQPAIDIVKAERTTTSPGNKSISSLVSCDIADLPRSVTREVPAKPRQRRTLECKSPDAEEPARIKRCVAECAPSDSPSTRNLVNYGSESEDSEDDEGDFVLAAPVPRVLNRYWNYYFEEEEDRITSPPPDASVPVTPATDSSMPATAPKPSSSFPPDTFYNFIWRPFDAASTQHDLRRSKFNQISRSPGSTAHYEHPYDAFVAIWDRSIMAQIAKETNVYAQQVSAKLLSCGSMGQKSGISAWKDTTVDELYVYFAIVMAMGIVVKSPVEEYWCSKSDIFQTLGFSTTMPIHRFQQLTKFLHFNDNSGMVAEDLDASEAKLFKLQPILNHLNARFSSLYNLGQNIALNESLTQWKGWLNISQKVRTKAEIKTYEVCDSQTGYMWRFEIHAGDLPLSPQNADPVSEAIPCLVLRLLNGLENRGHTVFMDHYYNSPALARKLKSLGFNCVGTLRPNRQFVPAELARMQKTQLAQGEVTGCTSGDVDILMWRDNNVVSLISTYHGNAVSEKNGVLKPVLVHDYNICMGGVDKKNQLLAMYPIERKSRGWYKQFFRRLLNVSILNSYILYSRSPNTRTRHVTPHRQFRIDLIHQILGIHKAALSIFNPVVPVNKIPDEYLKHYPEIMAAANWKENIRRHCVYCHKRTHTRCAGCNVTLCAFTCFVRYHKQ